jgi:hypothetical protein
MSSRFRCAWYATDLDELRPCRLLVVDLWLEAAEQVPLKIFDEHQD